MDPILGVIFVCWFIKVLAEDGYSTVTGKPNPRLDRRRARQKSRAGNPIWTQFVGWLGDVATDAREEQARRRKAKRARQEQERRNKEVIDAEVIDDAEFYEDDPLPGDDDEVPGHPDADASKYRKNQDPTGPEGIGLSTRPPSHEELSVGECQYDFCPFHGKPKRADCPHHDDKKAQEPAQQGQAANQKGFFDMEEFQGLDGCIAYCEALLAAVTEHTQAGASGEQYIPYLEGSKVSGASLQSGHDMQAAIGAAVAAIEEHKSHLENQKVVQEAYDANSDAGDKDFQTAGR